MLIFILFIAGGIYNFVFAYLGLYFTFGGLTLGAEADCFKVNFLEPGRMYSSVAACSLRWERALQLASLPLLHNVLVALCCDRLFAVFWPVRYHKSTKNYQFILVGGLASGLKTVRIIRLCFWNSTRLGVYHS